MRLRFDNGGWKPDTGSVEFMGPATSGSAQTRGGAFNASRGEGDER